MREPLLTLQAGELTVELWPDQEVVVYHERDVQDSPSGYHLRPLTQVETRWLQAVALPTILQRMNLSTTQETTA